MSSLSLYSADWSITSSRSLTNLLIRQINNTRTGWHFNFDHQGRKNITWWLSKRNCHFKSRFKIPSTITVLRVYVTPITWKQYFNSSSMFTRVGMSPPAKHGSDGTHNPAFVFITCTCTLSILGYSKSVNQNRPNVKLALHLLCS